MLTNELHPTQTVPTLPPEYMEAPHQIIILSFSINCTLSFMNATFIQNNCIEHDIPYVHGVLHVLLATYSQDRDILCNLSQIVKLILNYLHVIINGSIFVTLIAITDS